MLQFKIQYLELQPSAATSNPVSAEDQIWNAIFIFQALDEKGTVSILGQSFN